MVCGFIHKAKEYDIISTPVFKGWNSKYQNSGFFWDTGCNFKCLHCELIYYGKTIESVIIKLIHKDMCRDVGVIVLKRQVSKFSTVSVFKDLL